jgi:hypothetical protein
MNVNDIQTGLRVVSQIPLDQKTHFANETILQDLGPNDNLAFTYYEGMQVYCVLEKSRYEWVESPIGLLPVSFTYPNNLIINGVDYSNKEYNFVSTAIVVELPPLEKINEGNGDGIIIRGRVPGNYGNIGFRAIDLSYSGSVSSIAGATGVSSFASGDNTRASASYSTATGSDTIASATFSNASNNNTRASGNMSHAEGDDTEASGDTSHSEGQNTSASGAISHSQNLNTTASGKASHAEGEETTASGETSHVEGFQSRAIAKYSHAGGNNNDANAYCETSIGMFGTAPAGNPTTWVATDRIFSIGNGLNGGALSDAVAVLKNGLVTLPSVTNTLITAASGKAVVTKEYLASQIPPTPNGSETKVTAGTNVTVTGVGTSASPYVVNSTSSGGVLKVKTLSLDVPSNNMGYNLATGITDGTMIISVNVFFETLIPSAGYPAGVWISVSGAQTVDSGGLDDSGIAVTFTPTVVTEVGFSINNAIDINAAYVGAVGTNGAIGNPTRFTGFGSYGVRLVVTYI